MTGNREDAGFSRNLRGDEGLALLHRSVFERLAAQELVICALITTLTDYSAVPLDVVENNLAGASKHLMPDTSHGPTDINPFRVRELAKRTVDLIAQRQALGRELRKPAKERLKVVPGNMTASDK